MEIQVAMKGEFCEIEQEDIDEAINLYNQKTFAAYPDIPDMINLAKYDQTVMWLMLIGA